MFSSMSPYEPEFITIEGDNRVAFNPSHDPDIVTAGSAYLFPYFYRVNIEIPTRMKFRAWTICNLDKSDTSAWPVDIKTAIENSTESVESLNLVSMIFKVELKEKNRQKVRFTIPKVFRSFKWLPKANEIVIMKREPYGISFWDPEAHEHIVEAIAKNVL